MQLMKLGVAMLAAVATGAWAQTKWDMPTAYSPTSFHTENIKLFIAEVESFTSADTAPLLFHAGGYFALGSRL